MNSPSDIRNHVIDQLLSINDEEFLTALSKIIDHSHVESSVVALTDEQKLMLAMSEDDISKGKTIDQTLLHDQELEWLKGSNLD